MALPTILVVDDNASFREVIIAMLEGLEGEFVECSNGAAAMQYVETHRPDFVLMDLEMGGMDGMETTRRIMRRHPEALVFILSQHDDPDLRAAADRAGAAGYVAKDQLPSLRGLLVERLDAQA